MVKIDVCPGCFEAVRRARTTQVVVRVLSQCPKCSHQVQAVRVASKIRKSRLTLGDVVEVLRGAR